MPTADRTARVSTSLAHEGWAVLVCEPDGTIDGGSLGLYQDDARILSRHVLRLGREPLRPLARPVERGRTWSVALVASRQGGSPEGPRLPQDAWEVGIERAVGPGLH